MERLHQQVHPLKLSLTIVDSSGHSSTIISNDKHPYFAQISNSNDYAALANGSEGHHYRGEQALGQWMDAQNLKAGYRLLGENGQWFTVKQIEIEHHPLKAYNLTVAHDHTYFIKSPQGKQGVWVHNCNTTYSASGALAVGFGVSVGVEYTVPEGGGILDGYVSGAHFAAVAGVAAKGMLKSGADGTGNLGQVSTGTQQADNTGAVYVQGRVGGSIPFFSGGASATTGIQNTLGGGGNSSTYAGAELSGDAGLVAPGAEAAISAGYAFRRTNPSTTQNNTPTSTRSNTSAGGAVPTTIGGPVTFR